MKEKVIVAMSGGVDSSVAALLLQRQGVEVEGVFMKNWSPETAQGLDDCPWQQDQDDAAAVCAHLGIPFRSVNFEREYRERVLEYFLQEYAAGHTPNPDIMCNKEIKFRAFLEFAHSQGATRIATGHYAIAKNGFLFRGVDTHKDQSYFLSTLRKVQIEASIFPLGIYRKSEVRSIAKEANLPNAQKKDSQGICFIGHLDVQQYLRQHLKQVGQGKVFLAPLFQKGISLEQRLQSSVEVGSYFGSCYSTIGERAGHLVDNKKVREAVGGIDVPTLYVLAKNDGRGLIYLTENHSDPDLFTTSLTFTNWVGELSAEYVTLQSRYGQANLPTVIVREVDGEIMADAVQGFFYALASGQQAVVYDRKGKVLGSGVIHKKDGWL